MTEEDYDPDWEKKIQQEIAEECRQRKAQFWLKRFGTPDCVANYSFYAYEYLDDLSFMRPAREVLTDWDQAEALIAAVGQHFKQIGWEGDGLMQILWLPPFAGVGEHDNYGCYLLHVKHLNDGISWLASPIPLPFQRLFRRDNTTYPKPTSENAPTKVQRQGAVRWLHDLFEDSEDQK
jgi:hypothetical protein